MTNVFPRDVQIERNRITIETMRANNGKVEGRGPLLILHTRGHKTGQPYVTPVMYLPDGDRYVVFASVAGGPRHPHWYHHVMAHPDITVEVEGETVAVHASEVFGKEHDALYARQAESYPQFGEYQKRTTRTIPVVVLTPRR